VNGHDLSAYCLGVFFILIMLELTDLVWRLRFKEPISGSAPMLVFYIVAFTLLVSHTEW
jgi:hypothetical protein